MASRMYMRAVMMVELSKSFMEDRMVFDKQCLCTCLSHNGTFSFFIIF